MKNFFIRLAVFALCFIIFAGSSYLYLKNSPDTSTTDTEESNIPYSSLPNNAALLIDFPDTQILFEFDFTNSKMYVTMDNVNGTDFTENLFTAKGDKWFVAGMIDRVGGIELISDGEKLRFTGTQVIEILEKNDPALPDKYEVLTAFLQKASQTGISRNDLVYLIESCETDLTVPDCFYWHEYLGELCSNAEIYLD